MDLSILCLQKATKVALYYQKSSIAFFLELFISRKLHWTKSGQVTFRFFFCFCFFVCFFFDQKAPSLDHEKERVTCNIHLILPVSLLCPFYLSLPPPSLPCPLAGDTGKVILL